MRSVNLSATPGVTPARYSLRWRLPLIIAASLGVVIAGFLAVAYQEVRGKLLQAAGTRAQATADQLAGLFAQSTQQRLAELQRLSNHTTIRDLLAHPDDEHRDAARSHLTQVRTPALQIVEVWNTANECVLSIATPDSGANALPAGSMPSAAGVSPLHKRGEQVFAESVVEVAAAAAEGEARGAAPHARLGFVVVRRPLNGAPLADFLSRLVGQGAAISIGNKAGDVWTDLIKTIPPPPINLTRPGVAQISGPKGRSIGALTDVRGTPWTLWVEFPYAMVLAPARAFFQRMVLIAVGFLVLAAIGIRVVSARLTTPLHELTLASEAMAAGDYSHRVTIGRRDELGRLSVAFNAMAQQVQSAHAGLEEGVRQRTAKLEESGKLLEQRMLEIKAAREELERRVAELADVNRELESFSYSVSHDLRAPLRHITGFAMLLQEAESEKLDAEGQRYLKTIMDASTRMGRLIDDLLAFSRVGRTQLTRSSVDLNRLVQDARHEVSADINGRAVNWQLQDLPNVEGDPAMLRLVFVNLLSNALKYSATRPQSDIEVGVVPPHDSETVVFVKDNGVGFDMKYAHKLFGVFQRLHSGDEFEGTGIGLANVRRIVQRHGGRAWAEGEVDRGATFYVSLPNERVSEL